MLLSELLKNENLNAHLFAFFNTRPVRGGGIHFALKARILKVNF